jgi:hypothetical protein
MEVRILMREVLRDKLQNVAFFCLSSFLLLSCSSSYRLTFFSAYYGTFIFF